MRRIAWGVGAALLALMTAALLLWTERPPEAPPRPSLPPPAVHPLLDGGARRPHMDRVGMPRPMAESKGETNE